MQLENSNKSPIFGGFEAGGTKFNCVVGRGDGEIISRTSFPTRKPDETLFKVYQFFNQQEKNLGSIKAIGIAQFGSVEINPLSKQFGILGKTPKPYWSNTDVRSYFSKRFNIPIAIQTDVNGSAIGEHYFGVAKKIKNFVYITVGTGIGGGVYVNGELLQGASHPEIGHMLMANNLDDDEFVGCCPYHKNCLEGLASGTAMKERWNVNGSELSEDHPGWDLEAHYLALLCVNLTSFYSPELIVFGGGVMKQKHLISRIQQTFLKLTNGYFGNKIDGDIKKYIVLSMFEGNAAEKGVLVMAQREFEKKFKKEYE